MANQPAKENRSETSFPGGDISRDIVLIHGLWMTPLSFEKWAQRFEEHGYNVINRGWPGIENRSVQDIRRDPSALEGLGLTELLDHYEKIILELDRPPIIMGHSIGGVLVQMLLNKGLGSCGVAIHSVPTKGVMRMPFSTIKASWPALKNPTNVNRMVKLNPDEFHFAFTNTMTHEDSLRVYNQYYIPGPSRPLIQSLFANFNPNALTKVDYESHDRPALLFVSGGKDHIVPASVNRANAFSYHTVSATDYREYPERSHFTLGQSGWEEVADYCLRWAVDQSTMEESYEQELIH